MSSDIVSIKTRQLFREVMVGWVLREIADEFDAAKIECDLAYKPPVAGQRRNLVEQYYHSINWTNGKDVKKVLQVFENILYRAEKAVEVTFPRELKEQEEERFKMLLYFLEKDGFKWIEGRIVAALGMPMLDDIKETARSFDAQYMNDQIRRMESAIEEDPSLAIGTAKELIETCCKTILEERGKRVAGASDVSTLTKETLKVLKLVPEDVPDAAKGREIIKRILSNLGAIGNGLAELRGLYGTGHGKHGRTKGLKTRHARLAVGASATLTIFLFATHKEI